MALPGRFRGKRAPPGARAVFRAGAQLTVSAQTSLPLQSSQDAFEFIRSLAGELSDGKVDLPSFPEVAVRVRRILSDPKSSVDQVVRVVGSEPALAARLLRIANSASLNRSGKAVTDLRTAINRIGYNMVRSASISFAMAQIRKSNKLAGLEHHLQELWQREHARSPHSPSCWRAPAPRVNPDEAMLTGMMHGIGKLYVLTRGPSHPELFAERRHARGDRRGMAPLDRQGDSGELGVSREPWRRRSASRKSSTAPSRASADLSDVIAIAVLMARHRRGCAGARRGARRICRRARARA